MSIATRLINYSHNGTELEAYFACEEGSHGQRPAILIAHMWGGRVPFVEQKAEQLAGLGYAAMALDMYGKDVRGSTVEECSALMTPFMEDRPLLQSRMKAGLDTLRAQAEVDPDRVVAMGYCFGGLCVLDLARSGANIQGAVSFHGLLGAPGNTGGTTIKPKVLVLHGDKDPMAGPDDVSALREELTAAGADWQIHLYGEAMHAFTNPAANDHNLGTVYNESADKRSWQTFVNFLAEVVPV